MLRVAVIAGIYPMHERDPRAVVMEMRRHEVSNNGCQDNSIVERQSTAKDR